MTGKKISNAKKTPHTAASISDSTKSVHVWQQTALIRKINPVISHKNKTAEYISIVSPVAYSIINQQNRNVWSLWSLSYIPPRNILLQFCFFPKLQPFCWSTILYFSTNFPLTPCMRNGVHLRFQDQNSTLDLPTTKLYPNSSDIALQYRTFSHYVNVVNNKM